MQEIKVKSVLQEFLISDDKYSIVARIETRGCQKSLTILPKGYHKNDDTVREFKFWGSHAEVVERVAGLILRAAQLMEELK